MKNDKQPDSPLKAHQAWETALAARAKDREEQEASAWEGAMQAITMASTHGEFKCEWPPVRVLRFPGASTGEACRLGFHLTPRQVEKLRALGYRVRPSLLRRLGLGGCHVIEWDGKVVSRG